MFIDKLSKHSVNSVLRCIFPPCFLFDFKHLTIFNFRELKCERCLTSVVFVVF